MIRHHTLEQTPSDQHFKVLTTESRGHFYKNTRMLGEVTLCPEPCHTSQVDRKQISPFLKEHPHHLIKGYCGVEKLSILVT